MGYTNKTSHYELPQYVANDKPSWLGDFNAAMLKIDTVMADNDATAEAANSAATGAQTQVAALSSQLSTIQGQVNTAVDTATTADGKATTAQSVATQASTTASEAKALAETAKQSADLALPIGGGTMAGDLILNGAPTADNQAATKAYVDAGTKVVATSIPFAVNTTNVVGAQAIKCKYYNNGMVTFNISRTFKANVSQHDALYVDIGTVANNVFNIPENEYYAVGYVMTFNSSGAFQKRHVVEAKFSGGTTVLSIVGQAAELNNNVFTIMSTMLPVPEE